MQEKASAVQARHNAPTEFINPAVQDADGKTQGQTVMEMELTTNASPFVRMHEASVIQMFRENALENQERFAMTDWTMTATDMLMLPTVIAL